MAKLALRPANPFFSLPAFWEDEDWPFNAAHQQGLEVFETDSEVVVKAAVPGIKPEDVEVTFEDGVLRINARTEEKEEEKNKKKVVYQSRRMTSFNYSTSLPRPINSEALNAEIEDGVVTVTAPLAAEAKPKKVTVTAKK